MALDASLILAGRAPQLDDPLTIRAKQATLADLMGRQQLQQMQMQGKQLEMEGAQRARQEQQTLANLYRTAGNDPQALMQGMAQLGLGDRIPAFQEQQAKAGRAITEAEAAKLKLAQDRIKIVGARLSARLANPNITQEDVIGDLTALVQEGVIDQAHGARLARGLSANPRQDLLRAGLELMGENERISLVLGKTELQDQGGARQAFTTNQLTGQVTPGQTFAKTATPEALLTDERTRSEGAANRGVQIRGQNLTDARARELAQLSRDAAKDAREAAANKMLNPAQKVQDATEAIQLINQAEPLLKGSTGSYSGVAIDTLAQAFGIATPGAINAQQLKAIEGALVSKMPKMSGPQSDKDVQLYRQMAAVIGDATIPYAQKAAALDQVREIQERYAGLPTGSSKPKPKKGSGGATGSWEAPAAAGTVLRFDAQGNPLP